MNTFLTQRYLIKAHFFVVGVAAFFLFFHYSQNTFAQNNETNDPLRLTAIPARLGDTDYSLKGKPGELVQTSIQVKNTTDQPLQIQSVVEDFTVGDDGEQPTPVTGEDQTRWKLAKWTELTPSVQTLQPSELGTVNLFIQVPEDALPGGHYAMVMHSPVADVTKPTGSGSGIAQQIGTLLYFFVEGEIHQEAYLRDIQAKNFFEFGPVPFSFILENRSDVHLHPNVQVEIKNMLGQKSDSFLIESKNVFPGEQRKFDAFWNRKWGFGKYTATITANYGTAGQLVTGVFSFWMIPITIILAVLFSLLFLLVLTMLIKRKIDDEQRDDKEEKKQLKEKVRTPGHTQAVRFKDPQE